MIAGSLLQTMFRVQSGPVLTSRISRLQVRAMGKSKNRRRVWTDYKDIPLLDPDTSDEELMFNISPHGRSAPPVSMANYGNSINRSVTPYFGNPTIPVLKAKNPRQQLYIEKLESLTPSVVVATGPAGTGKTLLATHIGIRMLTEGKIKKLVLTRPAVSVDEEHGFLPGTLEEKMAPWLAPIFDVFYEYMSAQKIRSLMEQKTIEIAPLAYMRGRTFQNSYIIGDEMQNATQSQMLMLLTRIGMGSKLIITGDLAQHDRGYENNGLRDLTRKLENRDPEKVETSDIVFCKFLAGDVERHPVIKTILEMYA